MSAILDKYVPYGYRIIHGGHAPRQEPLSAGDVVIATGDRWLPFGRKVYFKIDKVVVINGETYYYLTNGPAFSHEQYERLYINYDHVVITGDFRDGMIPWQSSHYTYRALEKTFDYNSPLTWSWMPRVTVANPDDHKMPYLS